MISEYENVEKRKQDISINSKIAESLKMNQNSQSMNVLTSIGLKLIDAGNFGNK